MLLNMPKRKSDDQDKARDDRITMEVIVDAYGADERALGWYYYLEGKLHCPFTARCIAERAVSPLKAKEKVQVIGMPPEEECMREMFVLIRWGDGEWAVPLSQLKVVKANEETIEAVEDWHYWVEQGREF